MLRFPPVAREGWIWIGGCIVLAVLIHMTQLHPALALPVWVGAAFLAWFFRDPPRQIPIARCAIVSPINGQVVLVETCTDPCLDRPATHLRIRMGWLDVMSLFSPSQAKVIRQSRPPAQLDAPQDQHIRPHACISLQTDDGEILVMMLSGRHPLSRFACYAHIGERVGKGQRCGFCYFACQVDLFLPPHVRLNVKAGDRVQAATSLLGELKRRAGLSCPLPMPAQVRFNG